MKVSNNLSNNYSRSNRLVANQNGYSNRVSPKDVSFGMSAKPIVVNIMNFIEKNGFFAEFCILDFISLVAPRIAVGLNRDRDQTGKWNLKAGSEEARRELLSGPAIFLIPATILQGFKYFKPATFVPRDNMEKMTEVFKRVVSNTTKPEELKKADDITKTYAGALFDDAFGEFKFENDTVTKKGFRDRFIEILTAKDEKKGFFHRMTDAEKAAMPSNRFEKLVKEINLKNHIIPHDEESLRISGLTPEEIKTAAGKTEYKSLTESASQFHGDFHNFIKDMIPTVTQQDFKTNGTEGVKKAFDEFIKTVRTNRKWARIAATVTSFFAVGSFLLYLPKLYKVSNVSPAMDSAKRAADGGANEN